MISPAKLQASISEQAARTLVDAYLTDALGAAYTTSDSRGVHDADGWIFLIKHQNIPTPVGRITVAEKNSQVIALTGDELRDVCECVAYEQAREQGQIARDSQGYVLRYHAWRTARAYAAEQIAFYARTERPVIIEDTRPVWRATAFLQLQGRGRVCDLGAIDVDAHTGEVLPWGWRQRNHMRKRAQNAARRSA